MITLPRNVGQAIENLKAKGKSLYNYPSIILHADKHPNYRAIADFIQADPRNLPTYFEAIVNGFELDSSPEEKVLALYLNNKENGLRSEAATIRNVLNILGIQIDGVNG